MRPNMAARINERGPRSNLSDAAPRSQEKSTSAQEFFQPADVAAGALVKRGANAKLKHPESCGLVLSVVNGWVPNQEMWLGQKLARVDVAIIQALRPAMPRLSQNRGIAAGTSSSQMRPFSRLCPSHRHLPSSPL